MQVNPVGGQADRIRLARAALVREMPYLAAAAMSATLIETEQVPTLSVDKGLRLRYHPGFIAGVSDYDLVALVFHEILHWLRDHPGERGKALLRSLFEALEDEEKARLIFQVAYDLEVNDDLEEAFPQHTLHEGLFPERFGFPKGEAGETYAHWLLERLDPDREESLSFPPGLVEAGEGREGEGESLPGLTPGMAEAVRQATAREILEAAKAQGSIPEGLVRWARERLEPMVPWRALLREAIRRALTDLMARRFPTWSRPHRRSETLKPFLLPGKVGRSPRVACVVDTSGSMDDHLLSQAAAEVMGVLRAGARVTLYSTDAAVHMVRRVFRREDVEKLAGGGGTDMGVGIEQAIRDGHNLIVVLTDGLTPWPSSPVEARVVACILDRTAPDPPPWIRTVRAV
ncbi:MAG: VWA-like domain-containing protein [Thermus sp.]